MVFTVDGLNELRDDIIAEWDYGAYGAASGTLTVSEDDTYMTAEVERVARSSSSSPVDKRCELEFLLNSAQGNGFTLNEFGCFQADQTVLEDGEDASDWTAYGDATITADSTTKKVGSKSLRFSGTQATGFMSGTKTTNIGDVSTLTGAATGTPTEGSVTMFVRTDDVSRLSGTSSIKYRFGSDYANYAEASITNTNLADDTWYEWGIDLTSDIAISGTPAWTQLDYQEIEIETNDSVNVYFDNILFNGIMGIHESLPALEKTSAKEVTVTIIADVSNE